MRRRRRRSRGPARSCRGGGATRATAYAWAKSIEARNWTPADDGLAGVPKRGRGNLREGRFDSRRGRQFHTHYIYSVLRIAQGAVPWRLSASRPARTPSSGPAGAIVPSSSGAHAVPRSSAPAPTHSGHRANPSNHRPRHNRERAAAAGGDRAAAAAARGRGARRRRRGRRRPAARRRITAGRGRLRVRAEGRAAGQDGRAAEGEGSKEVATLHRKAPGWRTGRPGWAAARHQGIAWLADQHYRRCNGCYGPCLSSRCHLGETAGKRFTPAAHRKMHQIEDVLSNFCRIGGVGREVVVVSLQPSSR